MADNRRTAIRHSVSIVGKFSTTGEPADCSIVNLSLGGALLVAEKRHPMGERCHINFKIPTLEDAIDIAGTVRWSDDKSVGIQFDGLRARDVWGLNEYFKRLGDSSSEKP